ncbi:sulfatase family protein [Pelagicoccus mobilis]|uniref:Sulfatase-like hydrolase/transferase n=1 Tax=Pelagicoccus mobilis TaxID=415221 RepID=A0A934RVF6_9BACT|nr:sulfatase-like hydrolase/transferase [Pelagicoccus mobilis]MBK1875879.1 sulfatase-like hydrolase/transferase [Pelagicoccus mobilis]
MRKLILIGAMTLGLIVSFSRASDRPNIINIVVDDLGFADMSFKSFAPEDVSTPGIDRLRSLGIHFDNAYATAPVCSPARAGLITGRYQQRWGNYWFSEGGLPHREVTIPEALRTNGYRTMMIGKSHHNGGEAYHPLDHGFDEFLGFIHHTHDYLRLSEKDVEKYGEKNARQATIGPLTRGRDEKVSYEDEYITDVLTDAAVEYMGREGDGRPYYLRLNYNAVHHPTYVGDPKQLEKFGIEQFPFWDPEEMAWKKWHKKWGWLGEVDPDGRLRYLAALASLDEAISRILDTLESKGELENTIIVFSSDNGGTINTYSDNGPYSGFKYTLQEGGVRTPLIFAWKGNLPQDVTRSQLVSTMDIFPTLLALSGSSQIGDRDGISLLECIENPKASGHEKLVFDDGQSSWAVRYGKWRLAYREKPKKSELDSFRLTEDGKAVRSDPVLFPEGTFLYDIEVDPAESVNLVDQHPELVEKLTKLYRGWKKEMSPPVKTAPIR